MSAFVYIAGPYAAETPEDRAENVRHVKALSLLALGLSLAPVSVHAQIEAGHLGRDDDPKEREQGLRAACAIAEMVAKAEGHLWVITRDDGSLSSGCAREVEVFQRTPNAGPMVSRTWAEWREIIASVRPK